MYTQVVLLNADYSLLNAISWKRAICLMVKGKVEVIEASEQKVGEWVLPKVLRLVRRVQAIWQRRIGWSRRSLMLRDQFTCQYCGRSFRQGLTIDHVLPRSRGGQTSWTNTVAACFPCNSRKADRTPQESGMPLRSLPYQPAFREMLLWKCSGPADHLMFASS